MHRRIYRNVTPAPPKSIRRFQRCYFVYILANLHGTLYAGLTDDMRKRMIQHKSGTFDGFTRKYNIDRLMYFETFTESKIAIVSARLRSIGGRRRLLCFLRVIRSGRI